MPKKMVEEIDEVVRQFERYHYSKRSEFVVEALREKLQRMRASGAS